MMIMPMDPRPAGGTIAQALAEPKQRSTGKKILDFALEALTGIPSQHHREQAQQRQFDQFAQRSMLQQQLEQQQWERQAAWKRANPGPAQPTNTQRNYEFLKSLGREDLARSYLENQATAPPLVIPNADGTRTIYPQGAIPRAAPASPQVIQQLPPGVKPMGGAGQAAPRTFPR